ncbi:flagellar biosynthetic protein FliR, partial [Acinetobacter baumannii]
FNTMLATVILLLADGHHLMFRAFVESYQVPIGGIQMDGAFLSALLTLLFRLMLLAAQIAAPVSAVAVIVDVAAGVINK